MAEEADAWQEIRKKVEDWRKEHPELTEEQEDDFKYALKQLNKGEGANATRRRRIKVSIEEAFDELPDSPFTVSKTPDWATDEQIRNRDIVLERVAKTIEKAHNECAAFRMVYTAHGKSDGVFFTDGKSAGQRDDTARRNMLNNMLKGNDKYGRTWDGNFDPESKEAQVGQVIPTKKKAKKSKKTA
jgi:hypothetical protein